MPYSHGAVRMALTSKLGFTSDHSDHEVFELVVDGLVVAKTKISHQARGRDIGDRLLAMMARQCHVSGPVFRGAVDCRVSRDAFVAKCLETLSS